MTHSPTPEQYESLHKSFTESMIEISEQQALIKQLVDALVAAEECIDVSNETNPTLNVISDALYQAKIAGF